MIFLLCPANRFLCGQHDFPQLLQKSVYGHVCISCLCLSILWNIFLLLPVYQAHRWSHSYDFETYGNQTPYRRNTWIWQNTPERFLQFAFDVYFNVSIQSSSPLLQALEPEPTPTRIENATRDPADENKKKEEHLYPVVHCSTTALSPV